MFVKMSFMNETNITAGIQRQGLVGLVLFSVMTTLPCFVFLFINGVMLFTLRSKAVFTETSRYILLFNLLFAETGLLVQSQAMFLLSVTRVLLLYAVCCVLTALLTLFYVISPLTLVAMCLERYVAVCYPLRHAAVITVRNTGAAVCVIWTISSVHFITRLNLMLSDRSTLLMQMKDYCGKDSLHPDPVSQLYDETFTFSLFVLAGVSVSFSYVGIIVAAKSASTDKASAKKARKTLLLHLLQLSLSMSSTVHGSLLALLSKHLDRISVISVQIILYVALIIAPKCLSSLIYGLRDQTLRPVLMMHLSCRVVRLSRSS